MVFWRCGESSLGEMTPYYGYPAPAMPSVILDIGALLSRGLEREA